MEEVIYELVYFEKYIEGIEKHKKSGQKKLIEKIDKLLDELEEHPTTGTGKPEALKGFGKRVVYSRRIDQKHRLTYEVFEKEKCVELLACYGHYDEK